MHHIHKLHKKAEKNNIHKNLKLAVNSHAKLWNQTKDLKDVQASAAAEVLDWGEDDAALDIDFNAAKARIKGAQIEKLKGAKNEELKAKRNLAGLSDAEICYEVGGSKYVR